MVLMPRSPTAADRRRAASARRRRRPRRPARRRGTRRPGSARPRGRRAGGRGRRARPARPAGRGCCRWRVSAASSRTRRPAVEVAQPHHHPQRLARQRLVDLVADGQLGVVDRDGAGADQDRVALARAAGGCRSRAARLVTQRLVPSAAALRPSRVVANFQVTNGRPCSTAKVQARLRRARLVEPAARPRPRRRRRAARRAPPAATGLGRAGRRPPGVRRPRSAPAAHGPVRPVWLHGSRVTTAVAPRAASPASRERGDLGVRRARRRGGSPRRPRAPASSRSTQPTRGLGPSGTPGVRGERRARAASRRCSACA